jgi:hypothetical protein
VNDEGCLRGCRALPPKVPLTVATSFSRSARTETSQTETVTLSPFSAHRRRHASSSPAFRAHVCTRAPNPASSSTIACLPKDEHTHGSYALLSKETRSLTRQPSKLYTSNFIMYPMPLLPPVTSAVAPARLHRSSLLRPAADTSFFTSNYLYLRVYIYV